MKKTHFNPKLNALSLALTAALATMAPISAGAVTGPVTLTSGSVTYTTTSAISGAGTGVISGAFIGTVTNNGVISGTIGTLSNSGSISSLVIVAT